MTTPEAFAAAVCVSDIVAHSSDGGRRAQWRQWQG
jgi:hypothetical protein